MAGLRRMWWSRVVRASPVARVERETQSASWCCLKRGAPSTAFTEELLEELASTANLRLGHEQTAGRSVRTAPVSQRSRNNSFKQQFCCSQKNALRTALTGASRELRTLRPLENQRCYSAVLDRLLNAFLSATQFKPKPKRLDSLRLDAHLRHFHVRPDDHWRRRNVWRGRDSQHIDHFIRSTITAETSTTVSNRSVRASPSLM